MEKLVQDIDFLQSEIGHLSHAIADNNKEINAQIYIKKTLVNKEKRIFKYFIFL